MISHALTIVSNELSLHLAQYGAGAPTSVELGNISEGFKSVAAGGGVSREVLNLQIVNIKEEKSMKNRPNFKCSQLTQNVIYENQPVFLNCQILIVASHANYAEAMGMLSRAVRFFQFNNVFTQESVAQSSLSNKAPVNILDRLSEFKLIFDLYSPAMEEVNHMWGTLGGKQYPFALYVMRMLDLKFQAPVREAKLIVQTQQVILQKTTSDIIEKNRQVDNSALP